MENIGEILARYRKEAGLSQIEAAKKMTDLGSRINNTSISAWEKNVSKPNPCQFLLLCKIYGITDIYSAFLEPNPDNPLSELNDKGIEKALEYIELLKLDKRYIIPAIQKTLKNPDDQDSAQVISFPQRELPLYLLPASAGPGEFLDSDAYDMVVVGSDVPESASFGIRLNGDSMTPRYVDGQIVWVYRTSELLNGDIGIFYLDGNAYCKRLHKENNLLELLSINPAYAPIRVTESSDFRIYGRVVS